MATRNLKKGSRGNDVKTLQKNLKKLGLYKTGAIDGVFGNLTDKAVRTFQKKHKLVVDGVVGPKTRAALTAALKKKNTTKKTTAKSSGGGGGSGSAAPSRAPAKPNTTSPRRSAANIYYNPNGKGTKNARSAAEMAKYLESFTYTDPANGESDSASIELCNINLTWAGEWLPKKGDKFTASIDAFNWTKPGVNSRFNCGTFCCDDRNFSFPLNNTATINGTSVPEKQAFRSTQRTKTWKNITVKEIARRIAKKYKLKLYYDASTIKVKSKEQSKKDDCGFLKDLCSEYGLYFKVTTGQVVIYDAARFERKKCGATIYYSEVLSGEYNATLVGTYTGATIKYTKGSGKKEYTYKIGSGSRILTINEKVDSLKDARIKAKAQLAEENRKAETLKITVASAGKELYSGVCFNFKNAAEMSGKYFIDKAVHKVDVSAGYTIEIEAHKVQTPGGSSETNFKVGNRVKVNGKAYYSASGGKAKKCKNKTMYIKKIAGGKKYPYAVSKRKGGTRYGWCKKSSLKKT